LIRSSWLGWDRIEPANGEKETVSVSLNPYAIAIDENRREDGIGGEKKGVVVCFFQSPCHGKIRGIRKERHTREHKQPNPLIEYLDPCELNGTKTLLGP